MLDKDALTGRTKKGIELMCMVWSEEIDKTVICRERILPRSVASAKCGCRRQGRAGTPRGSSGTKALGAPLQLGAAVPAQENVC